MKLVLTFVFLAGSCNCLSLALDKPNSEDIYNFYDGDIKPVDYISKNKASSRIFGGEEVLPNAVPSLAGLDITHGDGKKVWCSGTLISPRFVLTAAHCLEDAANATVILGLHDRSLTTEPTRLTQIISKRNFIIHHSFDEDTFKNDIALIKLNQIVTPVEDVIEPVLLASDPYVVDENLDYTVFGWGYFNNSYILAPRLRAGVDKVISNQFCRETYGRLVRSTNVCLDGINGVTACIGDDGGPLFAPQIGLLPPIQIGLVSFRSDEGCDKYFPTVFTRISRYTKWLQRNTDL